MAKRICNVKRCLQSTLDTAHYRVGAWVPDSDIPDD